MASPKRSKSLGPKYKPTPSRREPALADGPDGSSGLEPMLPAEIPLWQPVRNVRRPVRDIRLYDDFPRKALYPEDYLYSAIFRNVLRRVGLDCLTFDHLFIHVSDGLMPVGRPQTGWSRSALVDFDYQAFRRANASARAMLMFDLLRGGILAIAREERLEVAKVEQAAAIIEQHGLETVLVGHSHETRKLAACVWWRQRPVEKPIPVYLRITDKATGTIRDVKLGNSPKGPHWDITALFGKVAFRPGQVWVLPNTSFNGRLMYEGKRPKAHVVDLATHRVTMPRV